MSDDFDKFMSQVYRQIRERKSGYDLETELARFRASMARMNTDPEYAAYIDRLADEQGNSVCDTHTPDYAKDGRCLTPSDAPCIVCGRPSRIILPPVIDP
jgi:hypothetical protein